MNRICTYLATVVASFALAASSFAAPATSAQTEKQQLEKASQELAQQAASTKGGPQQRFMMERKRIDQLIEDLDAGRPVSPSDIDRALERARMIP